MNRMVHHASSYDWNTWMMGLLRSALSGGSTALLTLGGATAIGVTSWKAWTMVGINFVGMALYRMGEFLQLHDGPDKLTASIDVAETAAAEQVVSAQKVVEAISDVKGKANGEH
jgi:hypothetical protein